MTKVNKEGIDKTTWNHLSIDSIAINKHPIYGGIVDFNFEGWFVIPHNDDILMGEKFATKQEAIEYLEKELLAWEMEGVGSEEKELT